MIERASRKVFVVRRWEQDETPPALAFTSPELAAAYNALPGVNPAEDVPVLDALPPHVVLYRRTQWIPKASLPFEHYWPRWNKAYAPARETKRTVFLDDEPAITRKATVVLVTDGDVVRIGVEGADRDEVRALFKKTLREQRRRLGTEDYHERAMAAMPPDYDPEAAIREEQRAHLRRWGLSNE